MTASSATARMTEFPPVRCDWRRLVRRHSIPPDAASPEACRAVILLCLHEQCTADGRHEKACADRAFESTLLSLR